MSILGQYGIQFFFSQSLVFGGGRGGGGGGILFSYCHMSDCQFVCNTAFS